MGTKENPDQLSQRLLHLATDQKATANQHHAKSSPRLFSADPRLELMLQYLNADFQARNDALAIELKETNEKLANTNEKLTKTNDQMSRVGTTLDRIVAKFEEKVVTGKDPDLMIAGHGSHLAADVTLVESALPAEITYPCTTKELAAFVNLHHSQLGHFFKLAKIHGDPTYHYAFSTGKGSVNKYKVRALHALYDYIKEHRPTWIKPEAFASIERYILLHGL